MCRPPPVARRDDIACPRQFLLQRHVIKIASDRQVPTAIGPNKSLHQRFGICAGPVREVGECDFRKSDLLDAGGPHGPKQAAATQVGGDDRSEEHTSELQSLMRLSYAVFCLKKK